MVAVCGARSRPALCIICFTSARPGIALGKKRVFSFKLTFLPAWRIMAWCQLLDLASRFGRKFKLLSSR
eukprot:5444527-Amphidinium_carterae.1